MKTCKKCKAEKDFSQFYKHSSSKDGYNTWCKPCWSSYEYTDEKKKKRSHSNIENQWQSSGKRKDYLRSYMLKKKYGINLEIYNQMMLEQNNKCRICGIDSSHCLNGLYVDHDHQTSEVRGLLCRDCNVAIGLLKESAIFMQNAISYLQKFKED